MNKKNRYIFALSAALVVWAISLVTYILLLGVAFHKFVRYPL